MPRSQRPHADGPPSARDSMKSLASQACGLAMLGAAGARRHRCAWAPHPIRPSCTLSVAGSLDRIVGGGNGTRKSSACGIDREKDKIRIERDDTRGQSRKNLGVARRASVGDAFVTGDQAVLNVACFLLCMLCTYLTFCLCKKW